MDIYRGDIFEYETTNGNVRKALVLSPDNRTAAKYISIIALQEEAKGSNNVPIQIPGGTDGVMYADCGMVSFTKRDLLQKFIRSATAIEMVRVTDMVADCLGIDIPAAEKVIEKVAEIPSVTSADEMEKLIKAQAEAEIYKGLYEDLLERSLR